MAIEDNTDIASLMEEFPDVMGDLRGRVRRPKAAPKKKEDEPEVKVIDPRFQSIIKGERYTPSPTLKRFHESAAFVRGVRGPVRGGKSTAMCQEILRRAREQEPAPDGIRYTRFVVVRNTYGELKDTTIKTWLDWVPEEVFGKFNRAQGEMRHHIKVQDIDCEVLFRALDKPDDVRKVLSLEVTGAWVNEAREIPKAIIDALGDRVGQYPARKDGGCTWRGLMLDTNSPDEDHWWFGLEQGKTPNGWEFFIQPGGMIEQDGRWIQNPLAENVGNLNDSNYYEIRAAGKRQDYIKVYYGNQYGFVQEGKPVWPEYYDVVHGSKSMLQFLPGKPVYIGIGLGLEPGALFGQRSEHGQWTVFDEFKADQVGTMAFADAISVKMKSDFPAGTSFRIYAKTPDQPFNDEAEQLQVLRARGVNVSGTRISDAVLRREVVAGVLNRLVRGEPALLISPKCKVARKGMAGGYYYARIQASGEERYHDEPVRNRYRALAEAVQFMLIGGGEDAYVFRSPKPKKIEYKEMGVV